MQVEIFKSTGWPTYEVRVGEDVWEMSERADSPNGVCMYSGPWNERKDMLKEHRLSPDQQIPIGMARAIVKLTLNQVAANFQMDQEETI